MKDGHWSKHFCLHFANEFNRCEICWQICIVVHSTKPWVIVPSVTTAATNSFFGPFFRTARVSLCEQSAVFWIFMWLQEIQLSLLPRADPVLKYTGRQASRQYYRNGTLELSRKTVTLSRFTLNTLPVASFPIPTSSKVYWLYSPAAW